MPRSGNVVKSLWLWRPQALRRAPTIVVFPILSCCQTAFEIFMHIPIDMGYSNR